MKVYSIINQKGGVGKSTTALAIGAGLTLKGYKVLFVDLDNQENLSTTLRAEPGGLTALDILQRPETTIKAIQHTEQGDIIASTPTLAIADTLLLNESRKEYRLKEALRRIKGYDYCIIDTPPALGILTVNALTASAEAIIPAQADLYSLQGIAKLYTTIELVKENSNPGLVIAGIVLTRFKERSIIRREVTKVVTEKARELGTKVFNTRIRECQALMEAQVRRTSIYKHAPKSNATADYTALVNELLKGERKK